MQFLSNPTVQFIITNVLVILGIIIAAIVAIAIYRRQSTKELAYEIISNSPVISVEAGLKGKAQVLYNGRSISDARLVVLRIWNAGSLAVTVSDYDVPITLSFGKVAEILDFEILDATPNNLQVSFKQDGQNLVLEPVLLNSQDSIRIKILLTQFSNIFNVNARIVGVKQIMRGESTYIGSYFRVIFNAAVSFRFLITFVVAGIFVTVFTTPRTFDAHEYIINLVSIVGASLVTFMLFWKLKDFVPKDVRLLFVLLMFGTFLTFVPLFLLIQLLLEHPFPPF